MESCKRISFQSLYSLTGKYRDLTGRIGKKVGKAVLFETVPKDQEVVPNLLYRIDEALADKAVFMGILSKDAAQSLSAGEKLDLVFHPGLSTNSTIDTISGRGLGLSSSPRA